MPEKKKEEFVVSDRRRFNVDEEASVQPREEMPSEPERAASVNSESERTEAAGEPAQQSGVGEMPEPPSQADQDAQHQAYRESNKHLEEPIRKATGRTAADFEMSFDRLCVSLYMTAMMQMGLMQEEGQQQMQPDLLGARQTIDTLGILQEKTKGNLTPGEQNLLQNFLFELRTNYVEITNLITRGPAPGSVAGPGGAPRR